MLLAWLFLFIFHWGIARRGIATALSQGVSAVWVVTYFLRGKSTLRLRWRFLRFDGPTCSKILLDRLAHVRPAVAAAMMYGVMLQPVEPAWAATWPSRCGARSIALHDADRDAGFRYQSGHPAGDRIQFRRKAVRSGQAGAAYGHPLRFRDNDPGLRHCLPDAGASDFALRRPKRPRNGRR